MLVAQAGFGAPFLSPFRLQLGIAGQDVVLIEIVHTHGVVVLIVEVVFRVGRVAAVQVFQSGVERLRGAQRGGVVHLYGVLRRFLAVVGIAVGHDVDGCAIAVVDGVEDGLVLTFDGTVRELVGQREQFRVLLVEKA